MGRSPIDACASGVNIPFVIHNLFGNVELIDEEEFLFDEICDIVCIIIEMNISEI